MKWKLATKLGLSFGVILAMMLLSSILAYRQSEEVRDRLDRALGFRVPEVELVKDLQRDIQYAASKLRQCLLAGSQKDREEKAVAAWEIAWQSVDKDIAGLSEMAPKFSLQENRDRVMRIKEGLTKLHEIQRDSIQIATHGEKDSVVKAGNNYADNGTPANDAIVKILQELADSSDKLLQQDVQAMLSANRTLVTTLFAATAVSMVIGIGVAAFLSRKISQTTKMVLEQAEAIASGDLTGEEVQILSEDELGDLARAINKMHANLRKLIQSIAENSQNVANASEEFSAVSQQITANSEETSAQANAVSSATDQVNRNLHTVATATEEMSASISEIAKNATESARVAGSAMKTATQTNIIVSKLGESSAEIGQVIKVITSIAQKTDLLALNATVEAARAGEVGAGFAVVANEVKELAKQTSTATEDISRKIDAIQTDAKAAVEALATISSIIGQMNEISGTIAAAVEEQSATSSEMARNLTEAAKGSGEVGQNISGVAQAAQNTSHGAADSHKAAQQLAQWSHRLREVVNQFKLEKNGIAARRTPSVSTPERRKSASETEAREEVLSR